MIKTQPLNQLCEIRFGHYAQPEASGPAAYLQVKQFDMEGQLEHSADEFLNLDKKSEAQLLQAGDILFVAKGSRLFAWCYDEAIGPAIASSVFFVLRPDQRQVNPHYLTAVLNAPTSLAAFQQIGAGTNIFSIRKSELGAFAVPLPPLHRQQQVASLAALHRQEVALAERIISQKKTRYNAIISQLIK